MNIIEEAIIYATTMHAGQTRKGMHVPYILHPLEVAQIISTMTEDEDIITAGILHDLTEETSVKPSEIEQHFGNRVAELIASDTESKPDDMSSSLTWKSAKENSINKLKNTEEIGVKMLWLSDKLSDLRSIHRQYTENGPEVWKLFQPTDSSMHRWYYQTIAEILEMDLNQTGAFKEFISHINAIWPGTFSDYKMHFKKYKEITLENAEIIGKGARSTVYRYDDELVLKVYNSQNMFKNIEHETQIARKALIAGIPTAIPFGIVTFENKYGSLFELVNSDSISNMIARDSSNVDSYAKIMADLALQIHSTDGTDMELPDYMPKVRLWVETGIAHVDTVLADKIYQILDSIPSVTTLIHGDFHTGNVMKQGDEYLIIDMELLSICHPIIELSRIYMFYVGLGERNPHLVESFMGFSYDTAKEYFSLFLQHYLGTEDPEKLQAVRNMAALLSYVHLIRKCFKNGVQMNETDQAACDYYIGKLQELLKQPLSFS